ncbi:DUF885 domain-containing protein [Parahaliea aestuarii]|uniref:DUF885 domain-containing protein n=1 Tax=Parahaliea aestuarii TaxID=1852021 RepID=A0A5C8ZRE4_9GAMM|nr:DUF885 domain-containing protein [Parahaliea aestuarii]TXS91066.1 DUF885 domain-containing protein [Parahaliea aestuarii]
MTRIYLLAFLALLSLSAHADWIEQSNRYAMQVLERQASVEPETVAAYGLSRFDAEVAHIGPGSHQRQLALYRELLAAIDGWRESEKNTRVIQDLEIMASAMQGELDTLQLEHQYLLPYVDLHAFLFNSFRSLLDPRVDRKRYPAALERLAKYTGQADGVTPITEQARSLTESRRADKTLLGPYRGEVENHLESAPHLLAGLRSVFEDSGLDGWQDGLALLEQQLADYGNWVRETVLPLAREDNRLPEALYVDSLKSYGVMDSPEALIAEGQYSYQLIRSQMQALAMRIAAERGWKDHRLVPVLRELKKQQVPQDELLALYRERLKTVEDIIRREQLVTLPGRDAVIRMASEAEAAAIPASFMSPPQLIDNTGQYGEFVLVQSNPALGPEAQMDDWSHDAMTWALLVHEARPGHELQFSRLVEDGTSLARAIYAFNSANAEGWGLYAESIMQPYLPLEGQLFDLYTRLMRAARMFLDPMVNTGQMSRDEAENFLVEQTALSRPMASSEADRYAFRLPGQATSYYYGYVRLMRLRTEVEIALGDDFSALEFHDFILKQGLLPPALLREAVLQQFGVSRD